MLIEIKTYAELDTEKLMAVYAESNLDNTAYFFPELEDKALAVKKVEEGFLRYLQTQFFAKADNSYWILEENGVWLSAVRLNPIDEGLYYLVALETHPAHRRQGHAAALLRGLIEVLKARGPFRLCDCVDKENLPSLRTHEACGFRLKTDPGLNYLTGETNEYDVGFEFTWDEANP